jgi:hypothetical protein
MDMLTEERLPFSDPVLERALRGAHSQAKPGTTVIWSRLPALLRIGIFFWNPRDTLETEWNLIVPGRGLPGPSGAKSNVGARFQRYGVLRQAE